MACSTQQDCRRQDSDGGGGFRILLARGSAGGNGPLKEVFRTRTPLPSLLSFPFVPFGLLFNVQGHVVTAMKFYPHFTAAIPP
ncbi:hypothetical protein CPC08DRAFT_715618 [Agrocybe pediades]|nr:hypothetical protein CPC08DRAFT_715618 [Agrocybe pediades]